MNGWGLLVYSAMNGRFNTGDYIQSIAAVRYLPQVDHYIDRERLAQSNAPAGTGLLLNGWFTHEPRTWPPTPSLEPLVTSFHINESVRQAFTAPESITWLKSMEPIGCRDRNTLQMLENAGIDAYFSACLTLTLNRADFVATANGGNRRGIFLVDPLPKLKSWKDIFATPGDFVRAIKHRRLGEPSRMRECLEQIIVSKVIDQATWLAHEVPARSSSHRKRFELARRRLAAYANAELVVTSRIHCALPCLAFGTPVIFLNSSTNDDVSACRFGGLLELLNVVNVDPLKRETSAQFDVDLPIGRSTIPANPSKHLGLAATLERICRTFVETGRREGA